MSPVRTGVYALVLLAACAIDIAIQDSYFKLATETLRALALVAGVGLSGIALLVAVLRNSSTFSATLRLLVVSWALCFWLNLVLLPKTGLLSGLAFTWQLGLLFLVITVVSMSLRTLAARAWRRAGTAICAGSMMFVVAQPLLASMAGTARSWPPAASAHAGSRLVDSVAGRRQATIFLLLDELSPEVASGFREDLLQAGLFVASGVIKAESDATAKVIPAMWTGDGFDRARPCSTTAICDEGNVLDFSKVTVTRPDVDIVGFYHPYCAMVGLRSCRRIDGSIDLFNSARWSCSIRRRLGLPVEESCRSNRYAHWLTVRSGVLSALWEAPLWREGGLLYAHVPLPHPPGSDDRGTLKLDYARNVLQARALVRRAASELQAGGFDDIRLVLFSDHPLRTWLWCKSAGYAESGCIADNQGLANEVPLLVASNAPVRPTFGDLRSNRDIFQLREN